MLFAVILTALALPLGSYMAKVYTRRAGVPLAASSRGPSGFLYRVLRVDSEREQDWKAYAKSLLIFSLAGWLLLYLILRTQNAFYVPHALNPLGFHSAPWNVTFNTVSSFVTNTNWQYYGGETTMSYLSQMIGLTVQNLLSAGVGIVVAVALIRGIVGRSGKSLGNFWQDIVRTVLYVLAADLGDRRARARLPGRDPELRHLPDGAHDHRPHAVDRDGPGRLAGGRSRSSAPTAAASSTSTPRTRSRTRRRSPTSSRCCWC